MRKVACLFTLLVSVVVCLLPAHAAQRDRVFVASYGSDSNPCTFGSPCKTFQNAVSVVAPGGEVTAIDSAGFGPVNISQSVTITSPAGVEAGIAATADYAIYIDAPGATVKLRGLTLDGANAASYGIRFLAGARLEVVNCTVSDFNAAGISVATETTTSVLISHTIVNDNNPTNNPNDYGIGVSLNPGAGGSITAALDHVTLSNNGLGLSATVSDPATASMETLITDSHIDNNIYAGMIIAGTTYSSGGAYISSAILKNVTLNDDGAGDGGLAIFALDYSSIWLSKVTQTSVTGFPATSIYFFPLGTDISVYSDGSNHLMGSTLDGSTMPWPPN